MCNFASKLKMNMKTYQPGLYDATIREAQRQRAANIGKFIADNNQLIINVDVLDSIGLYLIPFEKGNKVGFINKKGFVVIKPIYDEHKGEFFSEENIVAVRKEKKWSVIDCTGKELLPFKYSLIFPSCDSKLVVLETWDGYEAMDLTSEPFKVISKNEYKPIFPFRYGYAKVKKEGKWGIFNSSGKLVLDTKYIDMYSFHDYSSSTTMVRETENSELQKINLFDLK